mgnify:CR=1 FL=1
MAKITNYTTLQTEVANWLNRSSYSTDVPGWVQNAEDRINREIRTPDMEEIATGTTSDGSIALPTRFIEPIDLFILVGGEYYPLAYNLYNRIRNSFSTSGEPKYFTERDGELIVAPNPDGTYTYELLYYQAFDDLDSTATNGLLTAHPDIYLSASLSEANLFLKDLEQWQVWEGKYQELKRSVNKSYSDRKYPSGGLQMVSA